MSRLKGDGVSNALRVLFESGSAAGASDAELLERYAEGQPGSEAAFSALLDRHGPMVLAVCRRLAGGREAAEDAFQATFLALIRRAGSIRVADSLAPWLFAVARRIALRARAKAERLGGLEHPDSLPESRGESPLEAAQRAESIRLLFEEIGRLPEKYRAPVVLCHIERRTQDQAAEALGWPVGTLSGRLSRAHRLLQERLERRGLALSVGIWLAGLRNEATAAVPPSLEAATLRLMIGAASKTLAAGAVPAAILFLERGATTTMFTSLKMIALSALALGSVTTGTVLTLNGPLGDVPQPPTQEVGEVRKDAAPVEVSPSLSTEPTDDASASREDSDVEDALDRTKISLDSATVSQALAQIERATKTPIRVDRSALEALGNHLERSTRMVARNLSARTVLTSILEQLDLTFRVEDEAIVIMPKHVASYDTKLEQLEAENEQLRAEIEALRRRAGAKQGQGLATDRPGETPITGGAQVLADEPPDQPEADVEATPLDDMTADVTRIFVAKAADAMELESAWAAWQRLEAFEAEAGMDTDAEGSEIQQFLRQSRTRIRERLEDLAGSPDQAEAALERLQADLKRIWQLHAALTGDEGQSIGTLSQAMFARLRPKTNPNVFDQADMAAQGRVTAFFKSLEFPMERIRGFGGMGGGGFQ